MKTSEPTLSQLWFSWMTQSQQLLERYQGEINALNVFPVPDSDTGSNLLETVNAAVQDAPENAIADAARSARGNSGMIFSAWLSALVKSLGSSGVLTPEALHMGLWQAAAAARAVVSTPVEGTILLGMDAVARAEIAGELDTHAVYLAETAALAAYQSRQSLKEAAEAGIADAGAVGFMLVMNALSLTIAGQGIPEEHVRELLKAPAQKPSSRPAQHRGVEVMCRISLPATEMAGLRDRLEAVGESVIISSTGEETSRGLTWNIHVHVDSVQDALDALADYGEAEDLRTSSLDDGSPLGPATACKGSDRA